MIAVMRPDRDEGRDSLLLAIFVEGFQLFNSLFIRFMSPLMAAFLICVAAPSVV